MHKSSSRQQGQFRGGTRNAARKVLIPESLREVIEEIEDEITGMGGPDKYVGVNNPGQMLAEALLDDTVRYMILEYVESELSKPD